MAHFNLENEFIDASMLDISLKAVPAARWQCKQGEILPDMSNSSMNISTAFMNISPKGLAGCSPMESSSYMEEDPKKLETTTEATKTTKTDTPGPSTISYGHPFYDSYMYQSTVAAAERNVVSKQRALQHQLDSFALAQHISKRANGRFRKCRLDVKFCDPHYSTLPSVVTKTVDHFCHSAIKTKETALIAQQRVKRAQDDLAAAEAMAERARNDADMARNGLAGCCPMESSSYMEEDPKKFETTTEATETTKTVTPGPSTSCDHPFESISRYMGHSAAVAEKNVVARQRVLQCKQDSFVLAQGIAEQPHRSFRKCHLDAVTLCGPDYSTFQSVVTETVNHTRRTATKKNTTVPITQLQVKRPQDDLAFAQAMAKRARNNADMASYGTV